LDETFIHSIRESEDIEMFDHLIKIKFGN